MLHVINKCVCMCILCFFTLVKLESSVDLLQLDKYRTFDEINDFITSYITDYENTTKEIKIGRTTENRTIRGIQISSGNKPRYGFKPTILLDGGIHAREWVSTVAVLYTIHQLLANDFNSDLINEIDWFIFPMLNPDGYIYSMDPKGDRLWRKNRGDNLHSDCRGVDLNRNFGLAWGGPGSSDNPCDRNYRGSYPFSEPESKAYGDFIISHSPQIQMYLTLHSAAQAIIYPWGFTEKRPDDWQELDKIAKKAAEEMEKVRQTSYTVGPTTDTVGIGAGGSDDWAKGVAGVKYVFTMELPGLEYPRSGFHPPESELNGMSEETFVGIKVFANYLKDLFNVTHQHQLLGNIQPAALPSSPVPLSNPTTGLVFSQPLQWYNPLEYTFG